MVDRVVKIIYTFYGTWGFISGPSPGSGESTPHPSSVKVALLRRPNALL
jgi:hypothetical protein